MTTVQLVGGRVRLRIHLRAVTVGALSVVIVLVLFVVALTTGSFRVPVLDVVKSLLGTADPGISFVVNDLRLPRAALAIVAGGALGVAGALFQAVTRNALASPDVVGVQAGASTGALVQIIVIGGSGASIVGGALIGAVVAVAVVLLVVPLRQAGGVRFVLVGIAVAALAAAVNEYLSTRTDLASALAAALWQTGSLSGATPARVWPALVALVVLLPISVRIAAGLRVLALGDDLAAALGVRVTAVRLAAVGTAVGLTAAATAGAGPLLFVALAAPQIADRLVGRPGPSVVVAALTGAVLAQAADLVAQHVAGPNGLPAGVVTGVIGGIYLAVLLPRWGRTR